MCCFRKGFTFSLLYLTPSGLIYNNSSKEFVTAVDLRATLEPLELPVHGEHDTFRLPPVLRYSVSILSIELPKWHWEKIRHKEVFRNIDERRHVNLLGEGDQVEVRLALIHYSEFQTHFVPSWEEDAIRAHKRRKKFRDRFRWKGDDSLPWSHEIEHRYCRVAHSRL